MPELRKDPIVDRWVIIAKNRAQRPLELTEGEPTRRTALADCPFCEGHERETTEEVLAVRAAGSSANGPGWQIRVVTNLYPALLPDAAAFGPQPAALFDAQPALGAHEVVIEHPRHLLGTSDLTVGELTEVLLVYRDRLAALRAQNKYIQPVVFKNVGAAAGASIEHAHSQIMALPLVPREIAAELEAADRYHRQNRRCIYCQLLADELSSGGRLVHPVSNTAANIASTAFVAISAYAARTPLETWVLPAEHQSDFELLSAAGARELAAVMRAVVAKIDAALDRPAYNYIIHTSPFDTYANDHYHWHIEIIPRVTKTAGFEWGTGLAINPVPPEEAAAIMRALHLPG